MADITDPVTSRTAAGAQPVAARPLRRPIPSWVITVGSVAVLLGVWEIFGRDINPVFGSYPSAIAQAFWELAISGKLLSISFDPATWQISVRGAVLDSLEPVGLGDGLSILVGVPLGLVIGRFRPLEAALGIYVTAGYAMPLVALVPLLVLWLGLRFAREARSLFPVVLF